MSFSLMAEARAYAACVAQVSDETILEQRARQYLAWAGRAGIAGLEPAPSSSSAEVLGPLSQSRHLVSAELAALSVASRGHCRKMGKVEVLVSLLRLVIFGFEEIHGLAGAIMKGLQRLEVMAETTSSLLLALTKADLAALKTQLITSQRPLEFRSVLEMTSMLLQPSQKIHDDFAIQLLVSDFHLCAKAVAFRPEQMRLVIRQRLHKMMRMHHEDVEKAISQGGVPGALAQWLRAVLTANEEHPLICGMHLAKQAVTAHVVPLARWLLRPLSRPLLGRLAPPSAVPLPFPAVPLPLPERCGAAARCDAPAPSCSATCAGIRRPNKSRPTSAVALIRQHRTTAARPQSARMTPQDKPPPPWWANLVDGDTSRGAPSRGAPPAPAAPPVAKLPAHHAGPKRRVGEVLRDQRLLTEDDEPLTPRMAALRPIPPARKAWSTASTASTEDIGRGMQDDSLSSATPLELSSDEDESFGASDGFRTIEKVLERGFWAPGSAETSPPSLRPPSLR